uniref:hypothetical protein n=1 Tax=Amycolatopsis sp. CA-096443 TaxID=3239919 RepID=UPI003F491043
MVMHLDSNGQVRLGLFTESEAPVVTDQDVTEHDVAENDRGVARQAEADADIVLSCLHRAGIRLTTADRVAARTTDLAATCQHEH